jgi:hypothetical protein
LTLAQSPSVGTIGRELDSIIGPDAIAAEMRDRDGSQRLASPRRVPVAPDSGTARRVSRLALHFVYREPHENAERWASAASTLLDDLDQLPATEWCVVNTRGWRTIQEEAERLRDSSAHWDRDVARRATSSLVAARVRDVFARPEPEASPFRSVSTRSLQILHRLGVSLLVTTYQSGRVIMIRASHAQHT